MDTVPTVAGPCPYHVGMEGALGTAAAHATLAVPTAGPGDTVAATLRSMTGRRYESAAAVAVSGPLATVIQDLLSIAIYLAIVTVVVF